MIAPQANAPGRARHRLQPIAAGREVEPRAGEAQGEEGAAMEAGAQAGGEEAQAKTEAEAEEGAASAGGAYGTTPRAAAGTIWTTSSMLSSKGSLLRSYKCGRWRGQGAFTQDPSTVVLRLPCPLSPARALHGF